MPFPTPDRLQSSIDRLTLRVQDLEQLVAAQQEALAARLETLEASPSPDHLSVTSGAPVRLAETALDWDTMLRAASYEFSLPAGDLVGSTHKQDVVRARHILWWWARSSGMTYSEIARQTGRRDHSTVTHAVGRVAQYLRAAQASPSRIRQLAEEWSIEVSELEEASRAS